jgi:hypothetical protein
MRLAGALLAVLLLAGCGGTATTTVERPPNLGAPGSDAHDTRNGTGPNGDNTVTLYAAPHGKAVRPAYSGATGCGVERWAVKTMTDPGAEQVNLAPVPASIAGLIAIAPPQAPTDRVAPVETSDYQLTATLVYGKPEGDGDYHLVLEDHLGETMIVEAPLPSCARGSRVLAQITAVRKRLDERVPELSEGKTVKPFLDVTVTGVGFWDRLHGQTGVAPSGIELHPLTSIAFPQVSAVAPAERLTENKAAD